MDDKTRDGIESIWKRRGLRFAAGMNVSISLLLGAALVLMVNYLSFKYYARWDMSSSGYYHLSNKTVALIESLQADVDVTVFFETSNERLADVYTEIRNLLREYDYAASRPRIRRLKIRYVDPNRDLALTRELQQKYDLKDVNVIVFDSLGRKKYVELKEIADYALFQKKDGQIFRKRINFKGEQAFSSAIQSVVQERTPVVYFTSGHGEIRIEDVNQGGYSDLARALRRDNIAVRQESLAGMKTLPKDCSALIIAGPDNSFSAAEIDLISGYLDKSGRVLLLLDPGVETGLEKTLEKWGVRVRPETVLGITVSGKELLVSSYGNHPITKSLSDIVTTFYMPRLIQPLGGSDLMGDRPTVTALAMNGPDGWAESDPSQSPPKFDPDTDRRGPVAVAVATEKGATAAIDVEIQPTRLVVIGDSSFVSNGGLKSGGSGNLDLLMASINWLVSRETLMAIGPKSPEEIRLDMNHREYNLAFLVVVGAVPLLIAAAGIVVWLGRRS